MVQANWNGIMDSCLRLCMGVGSLRGGTGMGPRMREDNGWGWILACVFMGVGPVRGVRGWVPACARTTGGDGNEEGAATR